ncbi:MAG: MEDS domain-containing protein [Candidatus Thorarchaeota archaeon]
MTTLDDSVVLLSEFGLTPYEAKVYLVAVKLGLAAASKISKASAVRREEVYRTLPKLEKAGLIERVLGRPVKFRAIPIEDAVSLLLKRKEEAAIKELQELTGKKEKLIRLFESQTPKTDEKSDAAQFVLVSEKDTVAMRMESLIDSSISRIDIADSTPNVVRFLLNYEEHLKNALKRNVKVRILTEYPDEEEALQRILLHNLPKDEVRLRYLDDIPSRYVLFDGTDVMLSTSAKGALDESRSLWTQDTNLVSVIRRDFDEQFSRSVDWYTYISTPVENILRSLKHLRPRDHVVLFYDTPQLKHEILFNFIKSGLDRGEAAKYICAEETPSEIADAMRQYGIDVDAHQKSGALEIILYTDFYIKDGKFNVQDVMDSWQEFYNEARSSGFKGLRVTGEMSCFIQHNLTEDLLDYERALHSVLEIPIIAVCAYSSWTIEGVENPVNVYSELVKAHGKVLYVDEASAAGYLEIRK